MKRTHVTRSETKNSNATFVYASAAVFASTAARLFRTCEPDDEAPL